MLIFQPYGQIAKATTKKPNKNKKQKQNNTKKKEKRKRETKNKPNKQQTLNFKKWETFEKWFLT